MTAFNALTSLIVLGRRILEHAAGPLPSGLLLDLADAVAKAEAARAHDQGKSEALAKLAGTASPDAQSLAPEGRDAIPDGVYFGVDGNNFYNAKTHKGMGVEFWNKWAKRWNEFPAFDQPLAPVQVASPEEAAEIDAAMGLFELPPIRLDAELYERVRNDAKDKGIILQAHVRAVLELFNSKIEDQHTLKSFLELAKEQNTRLTEENARLISKLDSRVSNESILETLTENKRLKQQLDECSQSRIESNDRLTSQLSARCNEILSLNEAINILKTDLDATLDGLDDWRTAHKQMSDARDRDADDAINWRQLRAVAIENIDTLIFDRFQKMERRDEIIARGMTEINRLRDK